jgi:hypothetical protein
MRQFAYNLAFHFFVFQMVALVIILGVAIAARFA